MLKLLDISNHHEGINLGAILPQVDMVICKATEGLWFVDWTCDKFVQQAIAAGKPFGFFHFADDNDPVHEADYFMQHTAGYFGKGVPILDWETSQSPEWVNSFVRRVYDVSGVWPWIYANAWRFTENTEQNCMRWVAQYPEYTEHPTYTEALQYQWPQAPGLVGAWQFTSKGRLDGYGKNLDLSLYNGDFDSIKVYAGMKPQEQAKPEEKNPVIFECEHVQIIEKEV